MTHVTDCHSQLLSKNRPSIFAICMCGDEGQQPKLGLYLPALDL